MEKMTYGFRNWELRNEDEDIEFRELIEELDDENNDFYG